MTRAVTTATSSSMSRRTTIDAMTAAENSPNTSWCSRAVDSSAQHTEAPRKNMQQYRVEDDDRDDRHPVGGVEADRASQREVAQEARIDPRPAHAVGDDEAADHEEDVDALGAVAEQALHEPWDDDIERVAQRVVVY